MSKRGVGFLLNSAEAHADVSNWYCMLLNHDNSVTSILLTTLTIL